MDINRIISAIRSLKEDAPTNSTGPAVPGTGDDSSTVIVNKKKRPPILARGKMPGARKRWMK
jgi:hypothetical protein|tara:strand:+ start:600 stop:785 length:186 start_codon:yes stop_codon:yes gene_type:complete